MANAVAVVAASIKAASLFLSVCLFIVQPSLKVHMLTHVAHAAPAEWI